MKSYDKNDLESEISDDNIEHETFNNIDLESEIFNNNNIDLKSETFNNNNNDLESESSYENDLEYETFNNIESETIINNNDDLKNNLTTNNDSKNNLTINNDSENNLTINNDLKNNLTINNDLKNNLTTNNDLENNLTTEDNLEDYKCDVLFVGTNLYENEIFKNKTVSRKQVLDLIYQDKTIKLHTYGCDDLKKYYPDTYRGFLPYSECYKAFSGAKICLNISHIMDEHIPEVLNNVGLANGKIGYHSNNTNLNNVFYSDRVAQIVACESVVLSNNDLKGTLTKNQEYIFINNIDDLMPTIHKYLSITGLYNNMKAKSILRKEEFEYENIIKNMITSLITL